MSQEVCEHFLAADLAFVAAGGAAAQDVELGREVHSYAPVVVAVLEGLQAMPEDVVAQHITHLYPMLVELITCSDTGVCAALQQLFAGPVKRMLLAAAAH